MKKTSEYWLFDKIDRYILSKLINNNCFCFRTLLKRIEEYKLIWANLEQLEKSADAPNRYKNRGGKLLQEERERNKLQKKIPLLESELRMKANNFFERTGTIFLTWGETIDDLIMSLHNQQENVIILFDEFDVFYDF